MRKSLRSLAIDAAAVLARPFLRGAGCIVCLHRVLPEEERSPLPCNRALELSAQGLRGVLEWVRRRGLEPVSMDEVPARLREPRGGKFIAFTFDDGYRDNAMHALPIFREFGVPFTVNVTTGFLSGEAHPWWYVVERVLKDGDEVALPWFEDRALSLRTSSERNAAVERISERLRSMSHEERIQRLEELCGLAGLYAGDVTRELIMSWDELRAFAADPLVTIGAHGVTHSALSTLDAAAAATEFTRSRDELRANLGEAPRHFAFPFGGPSAAGDREFGLARDLGFLTSVTTRSGNLGHAAALHALPRIGISGNYEPVRRMRRLESGLPL